MLTELVERTIKPEWRTLIAAIACSYATAGLFYFSVRLARTLRAAALILATVAILGSPLLIPAEHQVLRLVAALAAIAMWVKVLDLYIAPSERPMTVWRWIAHLPSTVGIVWRKLEQQPQYGVVSELGRMVGGAVGCMLGAKAMQFAWRQYWLDLPFVVEHCVKVGLLFLTLMVGAYALSAAWRLAGGRAREIMDWPIVASTPADFWRRYNRPAQQFLYEDIFKQAGSRRHPGRAAAITFLVSAAIHEWLFAISLSAIQAYQFAFFALQGTAVVLTVRLRPRGALRLLCNLLTLCFMLATSLLFFASVNEVIPFYSERFPLWLRDWTLVRW